MVLKAANLRRIFHLLHVVAYVLMLLLVDELEEHVIIFRLTPYFAFAQLAVLQAIGSTMVAAPTSAQTGTRVDRHNGLVLSLEAVFLILDSSVVLDYTATALLAYLSCVHKIVVLGNPLRHFRKRPCSKLLLLLLIFT